MKVLTSSDRIDLTNRINGCIAENSHLELKHIWAFSAEETVLIENETAQKQIVWAFFALLDFKEFKK